MNINYEDIITKANARKDALKGISKILEGLDCHALQLADSLAYFVELRKLCLALDSEGCKLLGGAFMAANYAGLAAEGLRSSLFGGGQNAYVSRLRDIVDAS